MKVRTQQPVVTPLTPASKMSVVSTSSAEEKAPQTTTPSTPHSTPAESSIPTTAQRFKLAERGIVENFRRDQLRKAVEAGRLQSKNPAGGNNVNRVPRQSRLDYGADNLGANLAENLGARGSTSDTADAYGRPASGHLDSTKGPRQAATDPTGIVTSTFGLRGTGSTAYAMHRLPGGGGSHTNVHTEPGVSGRGPGRTEQASDENGMSVEGHESEEHEMSVEGYEQEEGGSSLEEASGDDGKYEWGDMGDVTAGPKIPRGLTYGQWADMYPDRAADARRDGPPAPRSTNPLGGMRWRNDTQTPTPDDVGGELPAWLQEMSDVAFGRPQQGMGDGVNEDHAGPTAPMPSEEQARATAESRISARQGERIQYGSEGGPAAPHDPDDVPSEEPDIGQGPENPTAPAQ